ncbi:MAG: methyltransferase domain-containing protein [Solirubrobacteraceae bacterium]|nr:methyltransferase domain-containing protein [Solirubrobacteraceae bacterium]
MTAPIVQQNQPDGVPPLELTGERTLPDVPEENYWFQRHLVVYRWIADQLAGKRVVDMACGEGYGSDLMATAAAQVTGVDANPEAFEHARLRYQRPNLKFVRELVEEYDEPCDAIVFLQTIEHVQEPKLLLERLFSRLPDNGALYVSTPNVLTLAPKGAERSDNPWHVHEYKPEEFADLCRSVAPVVEMHGLWHAGKLRLHELAIRHGRWDDLHKGLRFTKPFYDWFIPAISTGDFRLGQGDLSTSLDLIAVLRKA